MRNTILALLYIALVLCVGVGLQANEEDRLKNTLLHTWNESYRKNVYDCSNLACGVAFYLQEIKGYDTSVVVNTTTNHAWVRVKRTEGTVGYFARYYMLETTFMPPYYMGTIVKDSEYWNYDGAYEWYEYMKLPWKLYDDLLLEYNRTVKQGNEDYERLRQDYNRLVNQYNDVWQDYNQLITEYNELVGKYNRLRR